MEVTVKIKIKIKKMVSGISHPRVDKTEFPFEFPPRILNPCSELVTEEERRFRENNPIIDLKRRSRWRKVNE